MDLDNFAMFLVGSILVSLGLIVLAMAALLVNHLYVRYWKTVELFRIWNYEMPQGEYLFANNSITVTSTTPSANNTKDQ
jgi:hypothetical protein